jgi:Mrp family chromosome partitioning ATPase/capsular polysaccharide biosynthesis protein
MELVHYLRVVRRRWRTVAAITVVGLAIGLASGLLNSGTKTAGVTFYLAKHTLSGTEGATNLQRAAILCYDGDVPKRAAEKLGYESSQVLASKVTCEARPDVNLLYIAATGTDPDESLLIADTFATELTASLQREGEATKQAALDTFDRQISEYETEYWSLQAEAAAAKEAGDAPKADLLERRQAEISDKINGVRDQRNAALAAPAAKTQNLTTIQTAEAVPISKAAFERLAEAAPTQKTANGSVTGAATRQSQIDTAIADTGGMGMPMRAAIGTIVGLILGIVLVLVLDRIDPRLRTKAATEEAFGWPVVGEIPAFSPRERSHKVLIAADEPRSRAAEAFRVLRSALLFADASDASPDDHPIFARTAGSDDTAATPDAAPAPRGQVIMVTSPGPSEGKTTTVANLAAILAETGRSVLVVNCDFRRPRVHLHLDGTDDPRSVVDTKVPGVKLVTQVLDNPHDANPAEVVAVQRQVIRNAREMFDVVLLDTAPILTTNDATEVLNIADQVVIVAKAGKTHREAADRAAELLERRGAPVVGAVLVGATDIPTARYYYYGSDERRSTDTDGDPALDELLDPSGTAATPNPFSDLAPSGTHRDAAKTKTDTAEPADVNIADRGSPTADDLVPDPADTTESTAAGRPSKANGNGAGHSAGNGKGNGNGHGDAADDTRGDESDVVAAAEPTGAVTGDDSARGRRRGSKRSGSDTPESPSAP